MEDRIIELETKVAFQDDTISQLNDIIVRQQRQLEQLAEDVERIKRLVRAMAPSMVAPMNEETPPPHY